MHWLQTLDTKLFLFVNRSLANPFFDWLMPLLSGNGVPWLAAVLIAFPVALIWGSRRLRVCIVLMALAVAIGDGLIVNAVKKAVARPRPFVTLSEARLFGEVGKGYVAPLPDGSLPPNANRHSLPSAHAANWFAMATVAFLFYRRSAWFMVPLAAAVALSRVYNGVHYPSDIAIGAILGAGYAIAIVVATQTIWNFAGKRLLPAWHAKLPNLLNPEHGMRNAESPDSELRTPHSELDWLHLGYLLLLVTLAARWIYLGCGPLDLSGDEAYQWTWSKHLALSYYSKPPGIALLQKFGTLVGGDTGFGVRFCSPLLAAVTGLLLLRFLAREIGARAAFFALVALLAVPLLCVGSVLMTIDPPLVLCWVWGVVAGWRAVQPDGQIRDWLFVGLATGLGFLCKYTAALQLPCWLIFFALSPSARIHLKKPGPWLALGVFALCTLPVVIWNAEHGWATVGHVASNAKLDQQWHPTLTYFWEFIGSQAGFLNPVFFVAMIWASLAFWKRRAEKPLWLFLACMGVPLFHGYWLYSLHSRVQPNWPVAAILPLFCLAVLYWGERPRAAKAILIAGLVIGLPTIALLHDTSLTKIFADRLPGDADIAHRTRGWRETAQAVEQERQQFDTNAFIVADDYGATGLYSFYSPAARTAIGSPKPLVYCFRGDKAGNQFYFWDEYDYPKHRRGENAIYIDHLEAYKLESGWIWKWLRHQPVNFRQPLPQPSIPKALTAQFETVTNLGLREIKLSDGRVFHRIQIYGCYGLK